MKSILMAASAVCALALPAFAHADAASDAVARYVAWRGGAAFEKAEGLLLRGATDNGTYKGALERRIEPGRTVEKFNMGGLVTHRAYVGQGGWAMTLSGQVEPLSATAAELADERRRITFDDALRSATLQADETFDGKKVQVLRTALGGKDYYDLLLDPVSGALIADRLREDGDVTETRYSDWRMVEGVRLPFRQEQQVIGDPIGMTLTVTEADIDPTPDDNAFARPAPRKVYAFPAGKTATDPVGFEFYLGTRIYMPATVNGREVHGMLDSGAETTVLDKAFAESLGIKPSAVVTVVGTGGRELGELATGVTLRIGDMELHDLTVALMDLTPIATVIGRPMPVILGKEMFNEVVVDLDFAQQTIGFQDPVHFTPKPGAVAVPVSNANGLHAIPASIEGGEPVLFDFDLGNGSPLLVFPGYWKPHNLLAERPSSKALGGAIGGQKPRNVTTIKTLTLGGVVLKDIPASLGEEDGSALDTTQTLGNIGLPIFSRFELTTDYSRHRILLKPRREAIDLPFTRDRSGLGARLTDGVFSLSFIAPGSPADAAGLKAGQKIVAVNGQSAKDLAVAGLTKLRTGNAGETLTLAMDSGETVKLVLKDYF